MSSNTSSAFAERRPAMRVPVDLDATYATKGMPALRARVREISATGLRLHTLDKLREGVFVDILVTVAVDPRKPRLKLLGQVVRQVPGEGPPFVYGIKVVGDSVMKSTLRSAVLAISLAPNKSSADRTAPSTRR